MTDTEYVALIAKGYEPVLERLLICLGENPHQARKLTRFVGLLQGKSLETESEWEEFMSASEDACGYKPSFS